MISISTNPSGFCCPHGCDCFSSSTSFTYTSFNNSYHYSHSEDKTFKEISRNVLEKGFISVIKMKSQDFYLIGNGPTILSGECYDKETDCGMLLCPKKFMEVNVFPLNPVTLTGMIPMPQERYVVVFGGMFMAFVSYDQIFRGGDLCQSRVVSTQRIIVGGRRVEVGKIQVFYDNGSFETLEIKMKKKVVLVRSGAKKLGLNGAKITCICETKTSAYLGTSSGQILTVQGKALLRSNLTRGAVLQITTITDNLLVVLFENHSIGLLDTKYHAIRSIRTGRFTAIETIFQKDVLIAGDMDGNLHSFQINNEKVRLVSEITIKSAARNGKITKLVAVDEDTLALATEMGQFETIGRSTFRPKKKDVDRAAPIINEGSRYVKTSKGVWFMLQDGNLLSLSDYPALDRKWRLEGKGPYHTLKHYKDPDSPFEVVYAYGEEKFVLHYPGKGQNKSYSFNSPTHPTMLVSTESMVIQNGNMLTFYSLTAKNELEFVANFALRRGETKVTAFSRVTKSSKCYQVVYAHKSGEIRLLTSENPSDKEKRVTKCELMRVMLKDYVVSMIPESISPIIPNLLMLTAKGFYLTCGKKDPKSKEEKSELVVRTTKGYKSIIGRGYQVVKCGRNVALVGFKQSTINIYVLDSEQLFSYQTAGPKSWYILEKYQNKWRLNYAIVGQLIERIVIGHSQIEMSMPHASQIRCAAFVNSKADSENYTWRIVTGDDRGLMTVFSCSTGNDLKLSCYGTHQLDGAVRTVVSSGDLVAAGTSKGIFYVFDSRHRGLRLIAERNVRNVHYAITAISFIAENDSDDSESKKRVAVGLESGHVFLQKIDLDDDYIEMDFNWPEVMGITEDQQIKWFNVESGRHGQTVCLTNDGIGFSGYLRSGNFMKGDDRYSYLQIKNSEEEGDLPFSSPIHPLVQICAGFSDGRFIHYVPKKCASNVHSFLFDNIHSDEIIDVIYWVSENLLFLATLDITGLVVVRKLFCTEDGIYPAPGVLPHKFYTAVPQPKKMFYLPKIQDIVVLGRGLTTIKVEKHKFHTTSPVPVAEIDNEEALFELD